MAQMFQMIEEASIPVYSPGCLLLLTRALIIQVNTEPYQNPKAASALLAMASAHADLQKSVMEACRADLSVLLVSDYSENYRRTGQVGDDISWFRTRYASLCIRHGLADDCKPFRSMVAELHGNMLYCRLQDPPCEAPAKRARTTPAAVHHGKANLKHGLK